MFHLLTGWLGETGIKISLRIGLDQRFYRSFHNLIVPDASGTTQIDHVVVSKLGVFVIETKTFKGWIFGSLDSSTWCQSIFGRKYRFQNPVLQNYRHVSPRVLHPVVIFPGSCEFKTAMPPNVLKAGLPSYVSRFQQELLTELEVSGICRKLESLLADPTRSYRGKADYRSQATCEKRFRN
jgi:hypothetical protein